MERIYLKYSEAKDLLKEGDILAFDKKGWISYLVKSIGNGKASHLALVSKNIHGDWEAVETRELKGGRIVDLERYVDQNPGIISVYRAIPFFSELYYNTETNKVEQIRREFIPHTVSRCMRRLAGSRYDYTTIWKILKNRIFWWFKDINEISSDKIQKEAKYVCSTLIGHCFNINGYDLVKNMSDLYLTPAEVLRSARLCYLFTLKNEN